jgi:hypothetical protein
MSGSRWYPTTEQLKDPAALERTLRQVLNQHYALQDAHAALQKQVTQPTAKASGPPPGSGPTDTMLLGIPVVPIDTQRLTSGATLKYNKKNGNFEFV